MLLDNGETTWTEFEYMAPSYEYNKPYSIFEADPSTIEGSFPMGGTKSISPVCENNDTDRELALTNIKTIIERPQIVLKKPIATTAIPVLGQKINFSDTGVYNDISGSMHVRGITYDLNTEMMTVEGEGVIA